MKNDTIREETTKPNFYQTGDYRKALDDLFLGANPKAFSHAVSEADVQGENEKIIEKMSENYIFTNGSDIPSFQREVSLSSIRGRIDALYKNVIIEYKRPHYLEHTKYHNYESQLFEYMKSQEFHEKTIFGFLFDGFSIHCYKKSAKEQDIMRIEQYSGALTSENYDFLLRTIAGIDYKELTEKNIADDFAIMKSSLTREIFQTLFSMIQRNRSKTTDFFYHEWERQFKLSESDDFGKQDVPLRRKALAKLVGQEISDNNLEYTCLFSLHTTFSIIIKLIAARVVNEFKLHNTTIRFQELSHYDLTETKEFFRQLENGELFLQTNIINLVEGDYFGWYIEEVWNDAFSNLLRRLTSELTKYDHVRLITTNIKDLFRELYENSIPKEIRHSFGEYYTPNWLARNVVEQAIAIAKQDNFCGIDTCCGSGTFLIEMMNYIYERKALQKEKVTLAEITSRIKGIDLNPVAVLSARINYLLNILNLWDRKTYLEIPVYLGDAVYMPREIEVDQVDCLVYKLLVSKYVEVDDLEIVLPVSFVKQDRFFEKMDEIERYVQEQNLKRAVSVVLSEEEKKTYPRLNEQIEDWITKLIELKKRHMNSIWLRIIANYFRTSVLEPFDIMVGNPPWIDWKVLPENYRNTVKEYSFTDGIFSEDKNTGGISLNICALISNRGLARFVKDSGVQGLLMPKTLLFNKSYEGYRRLLIETGDGDVPSQAAFRYIQDFEYAGYPFYPVQLPFCAYYIAYGTPQEIISVDQYHLRTKENVSNLEQDYRKKRLYATSLNQKNNNFTLFEEDEEIEKVQKIIGTSDYQFRKGLGTTPYDVYRLIFKKNIDEKTAEFYRLKKVGNRMQPSEETIILEKKYIRPIITTTDLLDDFTCNYHMYTIFPYVDGEKQPVESSILKEECPLVYRYFLQHKKELLSQSSYNKRIQTSKEFYGCYRVGTYTYADHYVVTRDNTKAIFAYVDRLTTDWGQVVIPLFDGHISYITMDQEKEYISLEEAMYLLGISSLPVVRNFIETSSDARSIGTKFSYKLPKYDPNNSLHQEIAKLTQEMREDLKKKEENQKKITEIYEKL